MKVEEFFQKYANTPLEERKEMIKIDKHVSMSMTAIYGKLMELEDITRPYDIKRDNLLASVNWHYINKEDKE